MAKEVKQKTDGKKIFDTLYKFRLVIIIASIFLLGLIILFGVYGGFYASTNDVSFTAPASRDETTEYLKKFDSLNDIDSLSMTYIFSQQKKVSGTANDGWYKISFIIDSVNQDRILNVEITLLLHANWIKNFDFYSNTKTLTLSSTTEQEIYVYNTINLPKVEMWPFYVNYPVMYAKIDVTYKTDGVKTYYLRDRTLLRQTPVNGYQ